MDAPILDPGVASPEATPSAPSPADLAFPLPPLQPTEMGLPAAPTRTVAPPIPVPQLNAKQQLLKLAALGMMLGSAGQAGGPGGAPATGLAQGLSAAQEHLLQEQAHHQQLQQAHQTLLDRQFEQDQRTYQSATEQRQKDLQGAVQGIRGQLTKAKSLPQYNDLVDGFSNLLRARGYRGIDANWVRQVQPFVAPSQQDRASQALDNVLKNPLTQESLKSNPTGIVNGTVSFDANNDGTPETYTIQQLSVLAGRPMVVGPDGNPVVPTVKGEEIPADPFKAKVESLTAVFVATNRRPPTPKEKDSIVNEARAFTQEKPPNTTAADTALQRSYQFTSTQIEKLRAPVEQTVSKITEARDLLAQATPSSDALVIPKILSAAAGGQGSGLRMNQSELERISGGRSNWQGIQAWWQKWNTDPQKAGSLTPNQRQQLGAVLDALQTRAAAKLDTATKAGSALVDATEPLGHRRIFGQLQRDLQTLETSAPPPAATPPPTSAGGIDIAAPNGKVYHFATQPQADAFKRAAGIP